MTPDLAKRRRVMERSQRLGHCICDPRRPCPCDVFRDQQICPCAGERPDPVDFSKLQLTRLVRNPGCASKIAPADLEAVLARLPEVKDPAVISGLAAADDAAVYRIAENLCLVQTVDVFTPCVDDPHLFGRICAANCLSDIYAMGGEPRTALSILAFPSETLDGEIMYRMLAGAMETLGQAGVALVGGHSIKDDEIKLGFAVTGIIDPAVAAALAAPHPGDLLVLTKPLGTGVLAFCRQVGRENAAGSAAAQVAMATLNRAAAQAMKEAGASACTDVTGFGLFGHLLRLARQSRLTAQVFAGALPAFQGVLDALREGVISGAVERNREFAGDDLEVSPKVEEALVHLGCDAQTSGGLLIAIPPHRLRALRDALARGGAEGFLIGKFLEPSRGRIHLVVSETEQPRLLPAAQEPVTAMNPPPHSDAHSAECCADIFEAKAPSTITPDAQQAFGALLRAVQAPGALDAKTKELILFSLVVYSRCAPCFAAHREKARDLGLTRAELDEAAWCAIAMGGAPVRMFYQEATA
ncbi:MAG: selenide, water dikinase SelD [Limisphaerales bacterium]